MDVGPMIAETATVCVTAVTLYAMRLHEARTRLKAEQALQARLATSAEVSNMRTEIDALKERIEAESGRISGLALRR
jgi:hypothetical protein